MRLPFAVDPNKNPKGFIALAELMKSVMFWQALAVAVVPTKLREDEPEPFIFVDVPAWVGNGDIEDLHRLAKMDLVSQFLDVIRGDLCLPLRRSEDSEVLNLVEAIARFGSDTNRSYWVIIVTGPESKKVVVYLDYSPVEISTDELFNVIRRLVPAVSM
jgi:hypothetical protein